MPLNDLNKINIADWRNNPNVSVDIAKTIESASWKKSIWEPFVGAGQDRGIRTFKVSNTAPYRPRLKTQLQGDGVKGNADFETNLDNLEILSQTIYPEVLGNSIKSPIKYYSQVEEIDFIKEATDSLTGWIKDKRDRYFVTALFNDMTNAVICDSDGFKDTSKNKSVAEAAKTIKAGDVCNVKAIRRAIFMARAGKNYQNKDAFPIKPIRTNTRTQSGLEVQSYSYIILLDSYQAHQLKSDAEWKEIQKIGLRGDKNNLFTGLLGLIDDCPVIDMGVWTKTQSGFLNSEISDSEFNAHIYKPNHKKITPPSFYTGTNPVSFGCLIGASALVLAGNEQINFYIDDTQDLGRKTICGVDRILGVSKGRFESPTGQMSVYDDTDYAFIGILSSKE